MKPTLLLWDIDGTLIRNKGAGKRAMNRAFEELFGIANAFDDIQMGGGLDLHFIQTAFDRHQIDGARLDEYLEAYYKALQPELIPSKTKLMPGVIEILNETQKRPHLYNALGTGNTERGGRIKLDLYNLNPYFPIGGFCEGLVERYQMLQAGVEKACLHYGVDFAPENVIVIGDTLKDIAAARQMGAQVIAVATGAGSHDELAAAKPDLLLDDLTDQQRFFALCDGNPTP